SKLSARACLARLYPARAALRASTSYWCFDSRASACRASSLAANEYIDPIASEAAIMRRAAFPMIRFDSVINLVDAPADLVVSSPGSHRYRGAGPFLNRITRGKWRVRIPKIA